MNTRAAAVISGTTIFAMACGSLLGEAAGNVPLGAALGAAAGVPLGVFLVAHRRRWIAVALLNIEFVLSYAVGGFPSFLFSITAAALTFFVSACILRDFYGGSEMAAFRHHLKLAIGVVKGFQIIDGGRTVVPTGGSTLMGPVLVIVRPSNVVVTKRGPAIGRTSGPGIFTTAQFEYIAHVYAIEEKQATLILQDVLTHELVPTTIEAVVKYGLDIHRGAQMGREPLLATEHALVEALPFRTVDWDEATRAAVEGAIREVISRECLNQLLKPTHYGQLEQRIQGLTNTAARGWGVRANAIILKSVQPKANVTAATERRWVADTDADTLRTWEQGRAEATRNTLATIADGYEAAKDKHMQPDEIQREVLRHVLDRLARDPMAKLQLTPELNEIIRSLVG